jgi:DNA-binding CsgD family transcriptional regulator
VEDGTEPAFSAAVLAAVLPITRREAEVLAWVATGLSNLQIARELSISVRTVIKHLEHVYSKLGVPSRAAATALAFQTVRGGAAESASGVLDDLSGNPPEKE